MASYKKSCPNCEQSMVKNGRDKCGHQRWLCRNCGVSGRRRTDTRARDFAAFLKIILGETIHRDLPGQGRTFRRKSTEFWKIWPIFIPDGQVWDVIHVDGIYLRGIAVVLIAYAEGHVVGWHVARKENSRAYRDLLAKIPPPRVVVCDGGTGFEKARKECWPATRVQRCVFHVFCQIKKYTTTRSLTSAGRELYRLGIDLTHVKTPAQRDKWIQGFFAWCSRHEEFLAEKTTNDYGQIVDKHMRLVKARNMVARLVKSGRMFTFLDPALYEEEGKVGSIPSTNNPIEGGVNTQLRALLRAHRGMNINHQLRMIGWWCYMHTSDPASPAEILKIMPTDEHITHAYEQAARHYHSNDDPQWGSGIEWTDLHHTSPWNQPD